MGGVIEFIRKNLSLKIQNRRLLWAQIRIKSSVDEDIHKIYNLIPIESSNKDFRMKKNSNII